MINSWKEIEFDDQDCSCSNFLGSVFREFLATTEARWKAKKCVMQAGRQRHRNNASE